jgi:hypothetical protein
MGGMECGTVEWKGNVWLNGTCGMGCGTTEWKEPCCYKELVEWAVVLLKGRSHVSIKSGWDGMSFF